MTSLNQNNKMSVGGVKIPDIPIDYITKWIMDRSPKFGKNVTGIENRVLVIKAETGSGKSTALPYSIFRLFKSDDSSPYISKNIICTQPKVLTSKSIVLNELVDSKYFPGMKLGVNIGYQTGSESTQGVKGLLYSTLGLLTTQMSWNIEDVNVIDKDNEFINKYEVVLIDEAHERTLDNEKVIQELKHIYYRNYDNMYLPFLIFTSATIVPDLYLKIFDLPKQNYLYIEGRSFNIERIFSTSSSDIQTQIVDILKNIQKDDPYEPHIPSDVIIFMPQIYQGIEKTLITTFPDHIILSIDRKAVISQNTNYKNLFLKFDKRKVILATTVAETGLTIKDLKYVIESGFNKAQIYLPKYNANGVITLPTAKSKILQRIGRCGRNFDGIAFFTFSKEIFKKIPDQQMPDIVTQGYSDTILQYLLSYFKHRYILNETAFDISNIGLIENPTFECMQNSIDKLIDYEFISNKLTNEWPPNNKSGNCVNFTQLGYYAACLPSVSIQASKLIFDHKTRLSLIDIVSIALIDFVVMDVIADQKVMLTILKIDSLSSMECLNDLMVFLVLFNYCIEHNTFTVFKKNKLSTYLDNRENCLSNLVTNKINIFDNIENRITSDNYKRYTIELTKALIKTYYYNAFILKGDVATCSTGISITTKYYKKYKKLYTDSVILEQPRGSFNFKFKFQNMFALE
jgi:HrpA-like RNA helicase